jgi:hypothetical protein
VAQHALQADDQPAAGGDDLVEAQFAGAKAALKPIYDVEVSPKKT